MPFKKDPRTKAMYKRHKIYRWIALFAKIISIPLLQFAFHNTTGTITLPFTGTQSRSAFLSTLCALIIYYSIVFILNRKMNFKSQTSLAKSIAVYTIVVIILVTLEAVYASPLQNILYRDVLHLPFSGEVVSAGTVEVPLAYLCLGFAIQLGFSFITGIILFNLFRSVLNRQDRLDQI